MSGSREDVFDKIMRLPLFKKIEPFYKRHKEVLLYLFFGGVVTVVSIGSYQLACAVFGIDALVSNVISWILAVLTAYITSRIWVFRSTADTRGAVIKEIINFFGGRAATLAIEELIILVFVTWLQFNSLAVKLAAQVIVVLLNYVFSKLWIFKSN